MRIESKIIQNFNEGQSASQLICDFTAGNLRVYILDEAVNTRVYKLFTEKMIADDLFIDEKERQAILEKLEKGSFKQEGSNLQDEG